MIQAERTLVIWRRLGKEHGEGQGFRVNSNEVIDNHLYAKEQLYRKCPEDDWRWWKLNDEIIVEKPFPAVGYAPNTIIYYLPLRKWAFIENIKFSGLDPRWYWYIHIADFEYSTKYNAWIMTDLFTDVVVESTGIAHSVLDLDELASAREIGLISFPQMKTSLESCQHLLNHIQKQGFPPTPVAECMAFLRSMRWR